MNSEGFLSAKRNVTAAKLVPLEVSDGDKITNDAMLLLIFHTNWPFHNRARNMK